jgi:two-component system, OmpR family, sensor histidine kinase VicK
MLTLSSSHQSGKKMAREGTEVFYGVDTVMNTVLQFLFQSRSKIDACVDYTRPSLAIDIAILKRAFVDARKRGVKLRYATEITKDNIASCKQMMTMVDELRHLDGIKGNFYISETGYLAPATFHEAGKPAAQIIYSNVKEVIEHQKYVFETLWSKTIPAEQRIREIEEGTETEFYEVITDGKKASQILVDMTTAIQKEALIFLPNDKSMMRMDRLGLIDYLVKASQNGANVKIICQLSKENAEIQKKISENAPNIRILDGNNSPYGMYIIDRKKFLRAELKSPGAEKFSDAIGLVVYSNRRITVDSFASVFELLWNERMLVEELRKADRMQKEFISIAAHELKTPIQAILGMSSLLKYYPERTDQVIEVISRNAVRLQRLSANILDATRIESQTLKLAKERFNICDLIPTIIEDYREKIKDSTNDKVKLIYNDNSKNNNPIVVAADKERIIQVISNLLSNSIQFTSEGYISLNVVIDNNSNEVIVTVRDTGIGINPEIIPKLFLKFVTRSQKGTGLGLFISKSIIEAHGGRIWAQNNISDGQGTIFGFTLPLETKNGIEEKKEIEL